MSFKRTEKLSQSISLINDLELKTLYQLLHVVVLSTSSSSNTILSHKENEFLSSFDEQVLSGVKYIFETALYTSMNPDKLYNGLIELDMSEDRAEIFRVIWQEQGRTVVAKAREREMGPQILSSFSWRLQLHMSEQNLSKLTAPNCLFQFNLKNDTFISDNKEEELVVEFSQDDMYSFFQNLETIQAQLDELQ
jgi:hypothetical protein